MQQQNGVITFCFDLATARHRTNHHMGELNLPWKERHAMVLAGDINADLLTVADILGAVIDANI